MKPTFYSNNSKTLKVMMEAGIETLHQAVSFLYVARSGSQGVTVSDVRDNFSISQSSSSRALRFLSGSFNADREGLGLVMTRIDPTDARVKWFKLTEKGQQLLAKMES